MECLSLDKTRLQKFVSNKSFSFRDKLHAIKNRIGLTADGEFLSECKEVVLSLHKDCFL